MLACSAPAARAPGRQGDEGTSNDQREALLSNTERLDRTGLRLDEGYRMAVETEAVGAGILDDLHRHAPARSARAGRGPVRSLVTAASRMAHSQRETIVRTRDRLHGTDSTLKRSGYLLAGMARRAVQSRVIVLTICLVVMGLIGIIIYMKVKK